MLEEYPLIEIKTHIAMRLLTITALALPLATACALPRKRGTTNDAGSVDGKSFDYVIAGGGLGGMVLASRLSENASVSVLVLESGNDETGNDMVTIAGRYRDAFEVSLITVNLLLT